MSGELLPVSVIEPVNVEPARTSSSAPVIHVAPFTCAPNTCTTAASVARMPPLILEPSATTSDAPGRTVMAPLTLAPARHVTPLPTTRPPFRLPCTTSVHAGEPPGRTVARNERAAPMLPAASIARCSTVCVP
jgi:hypothetical protein